MKVNTNSRDQLRQQGEAAKQQGMALAAERKFDKVQRGKIDMLRALIKSPDGCATIDDATTDLAAEFRDGGRWRGSVVRSLSYDGIIERAGVALSDRPSRHRGYVGRWRLVDRIEAVRLLARLVAAMTATSTAANPESKTAPGATDAVSVKSTLPGFKQEGIENHGQVI